jgi:exonuclease VII small subunit
MSDSEFKEIVRELKTDLKTITKILESGFNRLEEKIKQLKK